MIRITFNEWIYFAPSELHQSTNDLPGALPQAFAFRAFGGCRAPRPRQRCSRTDCGDDPKRRRRFALPVHSKCSRSGMIVRVSGRLKIAQALKPGIMINNKIESPL